MNLRDLAKRYSKIVDLDRRGDYDYVVKEFVDFAKDVQSWNVDAFEDVYKLGRRLSAEFNLSYKDAEALFRDFLPKRVQGGLLGVFVTGVYSRTLKDNVIVLDGSNYRGTVTGIAYKHRKGKVIVRNCKALYLGYKMEGGFVEVFGDVRNYLGREMKGGTIIVHGNASDWVGFEMEGGRIVVEGNVGNAVGVNMKGGEIIIRGKAGFWVGEGKKGGRILTL